MKLKTKIRIFERTVNPVLGYGVQTWANNKEARSKTPIDRILSIKLRDKMKLEDLYEKTKARKSRQLPNCSNIVMQVS